MSICHMLGAASLLFGLIAVVMALRSRRNFNQAAEKYNVARVWYEERLEAIAAIEARIKGRTGE